MFNLLETIYIKDKRARNIEYHNNRFNKTREELFGIKSGFNLLSIISPPTNSIYRCRVLYNKEIKAIEYIPYYPKDIKTISFINSQIEYKYKYENRDELNSLKNQNSDEVIIIKDNLVTDTTIANIAFLDKNKKWITPDKPLLNGTMRQKLIDNGFLYTRDIKKDEIFNFDSIALMNAMVGFKIINPKFIN
ncbi:Aminodeoxychorismate lyase [hydrothermal vent metagenome]|uniref:Aminodeoxychorismate lyase n=1 Tax=hydrothermal vent metagenome TaxID=652676 RepID=A0A1W1BR13_9ZZZZ